MAGRPGTPLRAVRPAADNDIYTVLLLIALLFLLGALVFVGYKTVTTFGGLLPFGGG